MKLFQEKNPRNVSYNKAEHRKIIDSAIDLRLQVNQFNSPRVQRYKQQAFQNSQNSMIGLNPPFKKVQIDVVDTPQTKINNAAGYQIHTRAQSIYDQMLSTMNQKQDRQGTPQQQFKALSQNKQSKSNVQALVLADSTSGKNGLDSLVTKVSQPEIQHSQRSPYNYHSDMQIPRSTQTEKFSQTRNKQFHFPPQPSVNFTKQPITIKKQLPNILKPLNSSNEFTSKDNTKVVKPYQKGQKYYLSKVEAAFKSLNTFDVMHKLIRDHFVQTFQGLNFTKQFQAQKPNEKKKFSLVKAPFFKDKITVVFDLDETLVHCNDNINQPYDVLLNIQINPQTNIKAGINVRPYARQILANLKDDFEIIVFTASHICYAQKVYYVHIEVIEYLDPDGSIIQHRLFRDHCTLTTQNLYVKDLQVLCDEHRPLSRVVLVDNAAYSYGWQPENGIPIIPFYDNRSDKELQELELFLKGMLGTKDVRDYNRDQLRLHNLVESRGPQKAFHNLFGYEICL